MIQNLQKNNVQNKITMLFPTAKNKSNVHQDRNITAQVCYEVHKCSINGL